MRLIQLRSVYVTSIFNSRKEFVFNVEYADTAAHRHIINQRQITNTLVYTFNHKSNRIKENQTEQKYTMEEI